MSLFMAAAYFLPLLGGFLADRFFGKYWTIVGFSLPYVVGQYLVGMEDNKYIVVAALVLLAMGSGVIKPNISTLMGLTYDQQRPGRDQLRSDAFSWFYLAINVGAFLSQLIVPWIRTEYDSYFKAFLFPLGLMAVALVIFALGKRFYAKETIDRKVVGSVGEVKRPDSVTVTGLPIKYTIVTPEQKAEDRALKLQTLGRIGSLFLLIMFFWAIFDQSSSTWIFFADTYMDLHLFGISVPPDQLQSANPFFIVTLLPLSVLFFNRLAKRGIKIRATDKMIAGFMFTATSMGILALAGFLAGTKQPAVKVTLKEGILFLPAAKGKFKEASLTEAEFGQVRIAATDGKFNKDNNKWEFTNGTITANDGSVIVINGGRIDFEKSRGVFTKSQNVVVPGALELRLKEGAYAIGGDKLLISKDNAVQVKKGEKVEASNDKEPPKVTLMESEWVKPDERVTAWWQILAFFIITLGEILISVTGLELAFVAAPPTMKGFVTACWLATVGFANLVINAPITRLYQEIDPGQYYLMLAGALVVVTVVFIPLANRFNRGMAAAKAAEMEREATESDTEAV
jgi:dipeptide/tripeptide permease